MRFRIPLLILALGVLVGFMFLMDPGLDHRVTSAFYDATARKFPLATNFVLVTLRDLNRVIDIGAAVLLLGTLGWKLWRPERPMLIPGRAVLFLATTFILAPGLMANAIFKENWSRPRPVHVTEYGGQTHFVPWWDPRGTCKANCSFVSGEVSAATWTLAPAALVPPPQRTIAMAASIVFIGVIAVVRIAAGGHFLSDALFAALLSALIVWFMYDLIYRRWRGRITDESIDAQLARWGRKLRREKTG